MDNYKRHKLSRIEVAVRSYEPRLNWILRTDHFEAKLEDGIKNVIDLGYSQSVSGFILSILRFAWISPLHPFKDLLAPKLIQLELEIPDNTDEIFNVRSEVIVDGKQKSADLLDPLFDINLRFQEENEDEKIDQDSLLVVGKGAILKYY